MDISAKIKDGFPGKRVVIAGDLVADQFLRGTISRVSREAPVFILRHDETETLAGGAANAAVNVASLGGEPRLVGLVGKDAAGDLLSAELARNKVDLGFIVADESIRTTTKIRVLAGQHYAQRQQVIRIDYENKDIISAEVRNRLRKNLELAADGADAIIISDYNYGVADAELGDLAREIATAKSIPLLIDSRFRLSDFPNASSATPNQEEVEQILGKDFSDEDCSQLREKLGFKSLLVTCGNKGMLLVEQGQPPLRMAAIGSDEPVDVTGAGDTVIAVYGLGIASGFSFSDAATVANHAGGIVVMKKGTASVTTSELLDSINSVVRSNAHQ
ncbi:MAG: bifunctional heptose 7-phosphate kinase/heptose 1-phosphate adenyltransferase [Blastocatellia bacterium]